MIPNIRTTISTYAGGALSFGDIAVGLSGPFNDDYNQLNQIYQCHGNPNGKVYLNVPAAGVCVDVDAGAAYINLSSVLTKKCSNTGWVLQVL